MEGEVLSCGADAPTDLPEGVEITNIDLQALGERMRDADVIIPYGLLKQTNEPPPACAE